MATGTWKLKSHRDFQAEDSQCPAQSKSLWGAILFNICQKLLIIFFGFVKCPASLVLFLSCTCTQMHVCTFLICTYIIYKHTHMDKPIPHINILKKYLYTYICTHLIVCVHSVMFKACNSGAVNNDPWRTWPVENLPKYHCLECHRSINYALHEPSRSNVQGTHKTWEQWAVETKKWTVNSGQNKKRFTSQQPHFIRKCFIDVFPKRWFIHNVGKSGKVLETAQFPGLPPLDENMGWPTQSSTYIQT